MALEITNNKQTHMPAYKYSLTSLLNVFNDFAEKKGLTSLSRSKATSTLAKVFSEKNSVQNWQKADLDTMLEQQGLSKQPKQAIQSFFSSIPSLLTNIQLQEFVLALKQANCSDSTIKNYRSDINQFLEFTQGSKLSEVLTKPKIASFVRYQREKGLKDSSITRKLKSIAQFGLWAEESGINTVKQPWFHNLTINEILTPSKEQEKKPQEANQVVTKSWDEWSKKIKRQIAWRTRNQILPYLNLALIILFFLGVTIFGYQQLRSESTPTLAFPSDPVRPTRVLSFQGRLTDTAQNPITSSTSMRFYLYDADSGGTQLWDSGACSITPDQDGIFSTGLGDDCGSEIAATVFSENDSIWLEVEVESETLTPRQPIRTVPYALNSETVQGFPINSSESATINTILVMNEFGEVILGENSPTLQSVSGTFTLEGEALTLQTVPGSNGDITLSPDGTGGVVITSNTTIQGNGTLEGYLAAPGATFSATYAGGSSLVLNSGGASTDVQLWNAGDGSRLGRFTETSGGHGWFEVDNNAGTALFLVRADGGASYFNSGNFGFGDTSADAKVNIQSTTEQLRLDYDDSNYSSFTVADDGGLTIAGTGTDADITFNPGGDLIFSDLNCTANANGGALTVDASGIVSCSDDDSGSGTGYLRLSNGALSPLNDTTDFLIGGESTASADFAFINVNSGDPTASIAGNLALTAPTGADPATSLNILNGGTFNIQTSVGGNAGLTSRLFVDNDGNVGIGDASPASLFTVGDGDLFQVDSTGSIVSIDGVAHSIADVSGDLQFDSNGGQINFADGDVFNIGGVTGQGYNAISDSGTATFASSDNDLYVEGVLEVDGTLYVSGTAIDPSAQWANTSNVYHPANEYASVVDLVVGGTSTASANIQLLANGGAVFNEQGNDVDFRIEGSSDPELLYIDAGNNRVGIGTPTPTSTLEVSGQLSVDSSDSFFGNIFSGSYANLGSLGTTDVWLDARGNGADVGLNFRTKGAGDIFFRNDSTELVTILDGGNVGIGDTSPDALLNILGTTEQLRLDYDDSNYSSFTVASDGGLTIAGTGTDADITFNPGGDLIFADLNCSANANGGALTVDASGIVSCTDDDAGSGGTGYLRLASGALSPINDTTDFLIGGVSTESAKFAFINVNSGTPTASFSGNLAIATPEGADPAINFDALNGGSFNFRTSVGGDAGSATRVIIDNDGNLIPGADDTYNLGSDTARWANIYLGTGGASFGTSGDAGTIDFNTGTDAFDFTFGGSQLSIDDVSNRPTFSTSTATAIDFLENLRLSLDSIGVQIGASQDLQLTHDGTDSFVTSFTNDLFIAADDDSTASQIQFGLEDGSTVLGYFITGTANRGDFSVDSGTLYVDASTNAVGIGDSTPASLFTVGSGDLFQIDNTGSIVSIDGVAHSISDVGGDLQLNSNGGQINFADGDVFNIGGVTGQGYNAISDSGTATFASSDNDLYVEDILEVDGTLYVGGTEIDPTAQWQNTSNVLHPANEYASVVDLTLGGNSTASANVQFSSEGWGKLSGARTGQALLQLDEEGDQDILAASASGTTKLRITTNGDIIPGSNNSNNIGQVTNMNTLDQSLANADASFIGESGSDFAGATVNSAGDVNGDGYDDFLIGSLSNDDGGSSAGKTYLVFGKASGWSMDTDLSAVDASFIGEEASDFAGAISSAGDVNGDGYDDILIGAYFNDDGGSNAGQTYLILGKASGWTLDQDLSTADASFIGEDGSDFSGRSVSSAGDINGDGYDDILIGASGDTGGGFGAGKAYVIFGKASGWTLDQDLSTADAGFIGEDTNDNAGYVVSSAGDVNGDGYDDVLISATGDDDGGSAAGQTYLILGKASGWAFSQDLSTADASFIGEEASDNSGISISSAGDVNGDGYDDFLIGANANDAGGSNAGQAYLIFGKASGWAMDVDLSAVDASFIGEEANDSTGRAVSGAGDVNGDGYNDILIGAYASSSGSESYVILGKAAGWSMDTDLSTADASFLSEGDNGARVSGAGDVNGDGYDDILTGVETNDQGGTNAGQTYLILSDEKQFDTILSRHVTAGSSLRAGALSLIGETLSSTGQLKINSKNISVNQSGDLAITGTLQASNSLGISTDVNINNLLGISAAVGSAGSDLYWGDALICDVSELNCGVSGGLWENTANVIHAAGSEASVVDLVLGGTSTASATVQFSSQGWGTLTGARTGQALLQLNETGDQDIITASASGTTRFRLDTNGYVHAQRFVDIANSNYFLDPAATGTSLTTVGSAGIGTATPVGKFDVNGAVTGKALSIFNYTGTDQDIIVASNSGERRFSVGWDGHATISGSLTIGTGSLHLSDDANSSTIHSSSGNLNLQVGGIDSGLTGNSSVFFLDNEGTTRGRFDTKANNLDSGDGTDGSLSLTSLLNLNTTDSSASSDDNGTYADGIAYKIDVATASGLTVGTADAPNGLVSGDQVLLINLQGADGDTADAGNYEFLTIYSIEGNEITFTNSIQNSYDGTTPSNQDVVIQRVPQYTDVTLSSSGEITASAWDGLTTTPTGDAGYLTGIVAFRATGTVTVGGGTSINVDELGYRGGTGDANGGPNGESFDGLVGSGGNSNGAAGTSGGGAAGDGVGSTGTRGGGGGGGAGKNDAGGGGGAGGGYGGGGGAGGGGDRNSDNTAGDGGDGGDSNVRGGGGGGGNSSDGVGGDGGNAGSSGTGPSHGAVAATDASTGEGGTGQQSSTNIGGAGGGGGGLYGSSDLSTIFHGSGGGAGGAAGGSAFDGGDGGGTVYISAENLSLTGTISANGGAATASSTSNGGGGGGSGGSIYIQSPNSVNMGSSLITAASNTGQSGSGQSAGGGGGGGVGRIVVATLEESTTTGTTTPTYFESEFFSNYGTFYLGVTNTSSADIAEHYPSDQDLLLGEVVIFDPNKTLHIKRANSAYHQGMIGIISTDPGVILGQGDAKKYGDKTYPVALSGRIPVLISQDSEPIEIGDYLTSSNDPGKAQKATQSGMVVARALEPWNPGDGKKKIMSFAQLETIDVPLSEDEIAELEFEPIYDDSLPADLATTSATATDSATLVTEPIGYQLRTITGETISKTAAFSTAAIGNLRSGLISTQQLVAEQITISGVNLSEYITQQIQNMLSQNELLQPVVGNDLNIQIGTATQSGSLNVTNSTGDVVAQIDSKGNTSLLGALLVGGNATISGELTTATVSAQTVNAKSARIEELESRLAKLENIEAQTANIVNATISGTLYAENIDGFQDKVAAALEEPTLLGKLLGQGKTATDSASPAAAATIATSAGFEISGSATSSALPDLNALNLELADLEINAEDVTLVADAVFVNDYFKVNGNAFIGNSLGINSNLLVGESIKVGANTYLSDGNLSYIPTTTQPTLEIQPSGQGSLSLMAGLLSLNENGQAIITGDLTVAGNLTVENTLLTNLLTPVDFTNPLQVQLASRSGSIAGATDEVTESRFEIINELGAPVATISAQGRASFESGLGLGADNLTNSEDENTISTTKTAGSARVKAGSNQVTIKSPLITEDSLVYITPLGPTGNQVLYVKEKSANDPDTSENEASFTVGFENEVSNDIDFNWWIVN